MESLQCLGVLPDHVISQSICYPSQDAIQAQINEILNSHHDIKHVYVATDDVVAYNRLQLMFSDEVCGCHDYIVHHVIYTDRSMYTCTTLRGLKLTCSF